MVAAPAGVAERNRGKRISRHAVEVRRRTADRDQRVHIGGLMPCGGHRPGVELPAAPELHRRRQQPEDRRRHVPGQQSMEAAEQNRRRQ